MLRSDRAAATPDPVSPDALLVYRIAAIGDKSALAVLHARHGMTLYAVAYGLAFDGQAADAAVAATFHEVWCSAASFNARAGTVVRWLADLTRRAVHTRRAPRLPACRPHTVRCDDATLDPVPA
jgi:DNA-directed RNA polymerase specialized sigma24 family protein